jgi:CBS domain containing-hemolysin-like protein
MVPSTRMELINISDPYDVMMHGVIDTAHSRFPVFDGERENIIGILLAKDLLKLQRAPELNIRALLRPAVFVPESKGLNDLLRDFQSNHNHLAIVIDEFGRVAGLITIEDVLEQIVGEIEDEFDIADDEGDIFGLPDRSYRVSGDTLIERVENAFGVTLSSSDPDDEFETIGGLIAHEMGHVPKRGEHYVLSGLRLCGVAHQGWCGQVVQGVASARSTPVESSVCGFLSANHPDCALQPMLLAVLAGLMQACSLALSPLIVFTGPAWRRGRHLWWLQWLAMALLARTCC